MSQIWIFFAPGAGGDGFANLLELCHGMHVWGFDPKQPVWRVHRVVDGGVKFWAPPPDQGHCFRRGSRFDQSQNQLKQDYEQAVLDGHKLVVTSHDILLHNLDLSDRRDIFCQDQIKVLLDTRDYVNANRQCILKNLINVDATQLVDPLAAQRSLYARYLETDRSRFDHVIWAEDLGTTEGVVRILDQLNLTIDLSLLEQYHDLRAGRWQQILPLTPPVVQYKSRVEDGKIRYDITG